MQFSTENEKKIILVTAFVIIVVLLYSLSLNITGFVTADSFEKQLEDGEKKIAEAQAELQSAKETLTSCEGSLSTLNPKLAECSLNLISTKETAEECKIASASCESNLATAKNQYLQAISDYKLLAASSAASICCSFQDFQYGTVRSWKIDDNKISCNVGNLTVNCRTGETNV